MNAQKFTQKSLEAIQEAQNLAIENNNMQIDAQGIGLICKDLDAPFQILAAQQLHETIRHLFRRHANYAVTLCCGQSGNRTNVVVRVCNCPQFAL